MCPLEKSHAGADYLSASMGCGEHDRIGIEAGHRSPRGSDVQPALPPPMFPALRGTWTLPERSVALGTKLLVECLHQCGDFLACQDIADGLSTTMGLDDVALAQHRQLLRDG